MNPRLIFKIATLTLLLTSPLALTLSSDAQQYNPTGPCDIAFPLPRPSDVGTKAFQKVLYAFLEKRCYQNWVTDREIRNTGPFIMGKSFGTHNAVKIFYSPEAWDWLKKRNREGEIADGAVIVKEMFRDPAKQDAKLRGWTVMVKDRKASFDGWYWSYHAPGYTPDNPAIDYPDSGFGLYCLRCHASAAKESTFIDLRNIEHDPITFRIASPPPIPGAVFQDPKNEHQQMAETSPFAAGQFAKPRQSPDPNF